MRKTLDGSMMARGRKKRIVAIPMAAKKPTTLAHTMRRRILLTGGSDCASTTVVGFCFAATAFGTPLATAAVGVVVDFAAPGATRAAGGLPLGVSVLTGTGAAGGA